MSDLSELRRFYAYVDMSRQIAYKKAVKQELCYLGIGFPVAFAMTFGLLKLFFVICDVIEKVQ